MNTTFKTRTNAKCILAGEHAVLNNYYLIAKSIPHLQLTLEYHPNQQPLHLETDAHCSLSNENLLMFFYALLKKAMDLINKEMSELTGTFVLTTNIPIAAGLGFSAAISTALTDWIIWMQWLTPQEKFMFARQLEDMFHGKSSGADIAACMSTDIIIFKKPSLITTMTAAWQPNIYITTTNRTSITADAIEKVQTFRQAQPKLGVMTDTKMEQAALLIIEGLKNHTANSLQLIADAFNNATACFDLWSLIPDEMTAQMQELIHYGALAVKPTGAGNGGSILSLWENTPPAILKNKLISVF